MPVYDTFAKRKQRAENAGKPVIYRYDELPETFREQVVQILGDAIPSYEQRWVLIHNTLAREMGVPSLAKRMHPQHYWYAEICSEFLRDHEHIDWVLSFIEIAFGIIDQMRISNDPTQSFAPNQPLDDAIDELNHRFREHSIGYQYQAGQIIQLDSLYLHHEVMEPAITLLHDAGFQGALQEFMVAHRHYREQKHKEAITASGNAFESTMKTICDKRGWNYNPNRATASALIRILFDNDLIPSELKNHFDSLRAALENGLPTVRNQAGQGAHGQGATPVDVPDYLAAYCLHLAAANIVLLIEAHNAKG